MTMIGKFFDEVVIDNLNDLVDSIERDNTVRRHRQEGLSQEEKVWIASKFVEEHGQEYCNAIYNIAKGINDCDAENALTIRIEDEFNFNVAFYALYELAPGVGRAWKSYRLTTVYHASIWQYCEDQVRDFGTQAAPLAAMLLVAVLSRAFENYGFFVEVYTQEFDGGEKWLMDLSWEDGVPVDEADPELSAEEE